MGDRISTTFKAHTHAPGINLILDITWSPPKQALSGTKLDILTHCGSDLGEPSSLSCIKSLIEVVLVMGTPGLLSIAWEDAPPIK